MVIGQTLSGKTEWVKKLLLNAQDMFTDPPVKVIYLYKHWQKAYAEIARHLGDRVNFIEQVPTEAELKEMLHREGSQSQTQGHTLFIADDHMHEICTQELFLNSLTRIGHHENLSNLFIVQEGGLHGKLKRQINSNIHISVYMTTARDRNSLRNLGILLNDYQCLMASFEDSSSRGWGSYLCVDTHPATDPKLKYRSQIFPDDEYTVIYKSKK